MTANPRIALDDSVSPQLTDQLAEALVWSNDRVERANTLVQIVSCALDAIHWRLQPEGDPGEELSALAILEAATEHLVRMRR